MSCCCTGSKWVFSLVAAAGLAGAGYLAGTINSSSDKSARVVNASFVQPEKKPVQPEKVTDKAKQEAEKAAKQAEDAAKKTLAGAQPEEEMSPEAMMKMMSEWSAPTEEHKVLQGMVGEWDCVCTFQMGPDVEPMVTKGESSSESILDGRFVTQHFSMPEFMGTAFEGMGVVGYDKTKGKYVNAWIDSMGTSISTMEGEWDAAAKTMTWNGTFSTPMGEMPARHVIKHIDSDHTTMEFWDADPANPGGWVKSGEIAYTRRH